MSVYNRKMFKPRNARNALNRTAGIAPVQKFQNGGPVATLTGPRNYRTSSISGVPTGPFNLIPGVNISPPANPRATIPIYNAASRARRGTSLGGRAFIAPNRATTPGRAAELELARRALEGGLGSLSAGEQAMLGMSSGARSGSELVQPLADYLGDSPLSSFVEGAGEIGGSIAGGIGGGITGLLSGEPSNAAPPTVNIPPKGKNETVAQYEARFAKAMAEARGAATPDTLAGRLSGATPNVDYLRSLGFEFPTQVYNQQAGPPPPPAAGPRRPTSAAYFQQLTPPDSGGIPDGERAARERELERARAITAAGGTVDIDEVTGEVRPGPADDIQQLINAAEQTERSDRMLIEQAQGSDDSQTETTTETKSPTGSTAEQRTDTDPAADITVPQPKPENFAEIVAQAKAANASEGIPPQGNDQQEIQTAAERGTGSAEDIKADFLKLLPKYEEDPSVMGLNIALMGFTIAGGESSNALKNISDGMKKTLPNFIKSAQKKKAFERETDLLASKYTIQRLEGDRTADRSKNTYFVTSPFTGPDGVEYKEGIIRLNDKAFDVLQKAGLTGNLTTQSVLTAQINKKASEASSGLKLTDISKLYDGETREVFGVKYRINVPNASGLAANKTDSFVTENEFEAVTQGYVNSLEKFRALDKGIQEAIDIADEGRVSGPEGFFDRVVDASIAATPASVLERFGINKGEHLLSSANKFTRQHAVLSMQLAPLILGEAGKTISDADRVRVAQALGFSVTDSQPGVEGAGVQIGGPIQGFFTSEAQIKEALGKIQGVIRNRTEEQHREYQGFLKSANIPLGDAPDLPEVQSAFAGQGVAGITTGGLNYQIVDAPEDADYDLEIKFGD